MPRTLFDDDDAPREWEVAAEADRTIAKVVFSQPPDDVFEYVVPEALRDIIQPGQRVKVPLGRGNRPVTGYCVDVAARAETSRQLKAIAEVRDRRPLLSREMLDLARWIADRYLCTWGQVLESVIPAGVKKQAGTREIVCYQLVPPTTGASPAKLSKKQQAVLDVLAASTEPMPVGELTEKADCGTAPIQALVEKRLIRPLRIRKDWFNIDDAPVAKSQDLTLNPEQHTALEEILRSLRNNEHRTFLLHGVTGSGKTEVYIQAIREVVAYGKQAIVLVPEISLTPQTIRRFRSRFDAVAVLHSHLSDSERHYHWQQIQSGDVQVIVGARSAIFAPTKRLGLIVIDEEHETTFKQQSVPRYHARDVARERARRESIPLVLGSATPTLESLQRTKDGHDTLLRLTHRVEHRPLPPVLIVDVRNDPIVTKGHSIGRALQSSMNVALKEGGQVILFLNLRGYSTVLWCPRCNAGVRCPHCDITLTWHRDRKKVLCHSCEYSADAYTACPHCGQPGLRYFGAGTQRLEDEVKAKFADYKVLRMDSDSMQKPGSHDEALSKFRDGEVDILLGTQMIAKGLDFPNVTLVGVVAADTMLHQPDLRAAERTFQLIAQVAGRTGRGDKQGRVFVQTCCPDEPVITLASKHDYFTFAEMELRHRKERAAPPFAALARVIVRSATEQQAHQESVNLAERFRAEINRLQLPIKLIGPAPCPILRLRGQHRFHFQMSTASAETFQVLWREVSRKIKLPEGVEFVMDVDPLDMR